MKNFVAVGMLLPAIAAADPEHFVTLDRQDDSSRIGGELSYIGGPSGNDATKMRFDLHGQYVSAFSGLGGYASIPFGYLSGGGQSNQALGDIEAGALYVVRTSNPDTKLVLHGGLTLPTEKSSTTSTVIEFATVVPRLADFYQAIPEGTSLRVGVSPLVRQGQLFARADFGLDANLSDTGNTTFSTVLRFQFGAGIDLGQVALMVESTNLYATSDGGGWINTGALAARFDAGSVTPYAALVIPLDHDAKLAMDEALTLGLEGKLQ